MNQRERPPFSTISGTMVQLGERDMIAIYRWDDLSWVAHFRDGYGELSDATTWFRVHAGWLRSCCVGSVAALETVTTLTQEMIEKIGRLHRQTEAEQARRAGKSLAAIAAIGRACEKVAPGLHGWIADQLVDAASWFRSHAGALRYSLSRRATAFESMTPISAQLADDLERLHRRVERARLAPPKTRPVDAAPIRHEESPQRGGSMSSEAHSAHACGASDV